MKTKILFLLNLYILNAQNLTGVWKSIDQEGSTFYGELHLVHDTKNNTIKGYTFDYESNGYCKYTFVGEFNTSEKNLIGQNKELIEKTEAHQSSTYDLYHEKKSGKDYLKGNISVLGRFKNNIPGFNFNNNVSEKKYIRISKKVDLKTINNPIDSKFTGNKTINKDEIIQSSHDSKKQAEIEEYFAFTGSKKNKNIDNKIESETKPETINKNIDQKKTERKDVLVNTYNLNDSKIKLEFYDFGQEDGDIISVFYNDKIIIKDMIIRNKSNSYIYDLELDKNSVDHVLTFVAHNLGKVPPNTAELEIITSNKIYYQKLSLNEHENNTIILKVNN